MPQVRILIRALMVLGTTFLVGFITLLFPGCDKTTTTYVEVDGQSVHEEREGKYNAVRVGVYYTTKFSHQAVHGIGSPITSAHATSPKPPVITNKLTSLYITGNVNFNSDFQAGEDWSSMFNVLASGGSNFIQFPFDLTSSGGRLMLTLNSAPSSVINVVLTVTSTFDNGFSVSTNSGTLIVTP